MTQNKSNHELEDAIRAVRIDEPTAEEIRSAASRVMQKLEGSRAVQQPEMIRGCEDVQHLLPAFNAGELTANRALVVEAHLRDCVNCRLHSRGLANDKLKWVPAPSVPRSRGWNPFVMAA